LTPKTLATNTPVTSTERMRIVAGESGGRKLVAPEGDQTRPTSERVREAIFNALFSQGLIEDARVLDMFAGSGALGLEALSRGAATGVFVESSRRAVSAIHQNIDTLGYEDRTTVLTTSIMTWLVRQTPPDNGEVAFDLALCDPPYAFDEWDVVLGHTPASVLVIESSREAARRIDELVETQSGGAANRWDVLRSRRYGGTVVTILERIFAPAGAGGSSIEEARCDSSNPSSTH